MIMTGLLLQEAYNLDKGWGGPKEKLTIMQIRCYKSDVTRFKNCNNDSLRDQL